MNYSIKDSEEYRDILAAEIAKNYHAPVELIFVKDVAEWLSERSGDCTNNPVAVSIQDSESGGYGIIIRKEIDADRVTSIIGRVHFGGFLDAADILSTPETFMRHLVLHELAHISNNWPQERENDCDAWAFVRLTSRAV